MKRSIFKIFFIFVIGALISSCIYSQSHTRLNYDNLKYPVSLNKYLDVEKEYAVIGKMDLIARKATDEDINLGQLLNEQIRQHNADGIINLKIKFERIEGEKKVVIIQLVSSALAILSSSLFFKGHSTMASISLGAAVVGSIYSLIQPLPMIIKLNGQFVKFNENPVQ